MGDVGDKISAKNARWSFGGEVPSSFDEHVCRSVPMYKEGHEIAVAISDFFIQTGSTIYDLGCSTGELTHKLARANNDRKVNIIGIEVEPVMAKAAKKKTSEFHNVKILQENIIDAELESTDFIVAYYTIQFIQPAFRQLLFDKIYNSLNWGGGFLLFEKVRAPDARFQDMMSLLYVDHKLKKGFSESEIVNKSRSLKGVLEPFSTQGNIDMMKRSGFVDIMTVFKHICFEGFLAIK